MINLNGSVNNFKFRCPSEYPTVVKDTLPIPYMKCTNGSGEVLRLGENAYIPEYMTDDDTSTKWVSGEVPEVNITVQLKTLLQVCIDMTQIYSEIHIIKYLFTK